MKNTMNDIDKETFMLKFITKKLSKEIDISSEDIGIGKTFFNGVTIEDEESDEEVFIELYTEIPIFKNEYSISIEEISKAFNKDIEPFVYEFRSFIKDKIAFIVHSIFNKTIKYKISEEKNYIPRMEDLELDIGIENNFFVVQINLIADLEVNFSEE